MPLSGELRRTLVRVVLELGIYAVLVVVYIYIIFSLFERELIFLSQRDRVLYAALALGLMVVQGIILESVTTFLLDRLNL
jgi:hypothetical protein